MRWDNLFDDLEGQLEQELSAEELDLKAEEERLRLGRLGIRDRLIAAKGEPLRLVLTSGEPLTVRSPNFGKDWLSADIVDDSRRDSQCIVPLAAIAAVVFTRTQLERSLAPVPPAVSGASLPARLSLSFVLRDLCRRRAALELRTPLGAFYGTIDRVGRDHLDLAVHEAGEPRRDAVVSQSRLVPLEQIVLVRV